MQADCREDPPLPQLDLQRRHQRVHVLLGIEQVSRDAVPVEPVLGDDLQLDIVFGAHPLLKCATLNIIRQPVG